MSTVHLGQFAKGFYLTLALGLLVSLSACNSQPVSNTPSQAPPSAEITVHYPAQTFVPTASEVFPESTQALSTSPAVPTLTTLPSPTPCSPLATNGPYLIYFPEFSADSPLVIMDTSGGCRTIELPAGAFVYNLRSSLSPDGKWLAFHTSSTYNSRDLILHLMDLSNETVHSISRLVADGYPENMLPLAEEALAQRPDFLDCQTVECWLSIVELAFDSGIRSLAWSPDGRYLAFAGQIDGLSSDLYLLDMESEEIRRMTDDRLNIYTIRWSPDMEWILYQNAVPGAYQGATMHVVSPDANTVIDPPSLVDEVWWWMGIGWLSDNQYMIVSSWDGGGPGNLRYVNIENGQTTMLWPDIYFTYAIDHDGGMLALSTFQDANGPSETGQGLFFIDFNGNREQVSDTEYQSLYYLGSLDYPFLGVDMEGVAGIASDGSATHLSNRAWASISPDRGSYILYDDGVDLYSSDGQLIDSFDSIEPFLWLPDSSGLYLRSQDDLYYLAVPDGEPVPIYRCTGACGYYYWRDFAVVP